MQVQLITPEKILFEGAASYVQVPGALGEFGVFPGHEPLISTLSPGMVAIELSNGEKREFPVASGVAEVLPERVTLLVEEK